MPDDFFNFEPFYRLVSSINRFSRFVEVGVYTGASCAFLARQLKARGAPFDLYAVDLWDEVNKLTDYDRQINKAVYDAFMARLVADGTTTDVTIVKEESAKAAARFPDHSLDFVFIDANHTYDHVIADIRAWKPKISPGGMLAGHDYGEPCGVKQAVDELILNVSVMGTCWHTYL